MEMCSPRARAREGTRNREGAVRARARSRNVGRARRVSPVDSLHVRLLDLLSFYCLVLLDSLVLVRFVILPLFFIFFIFLGMMVEKELFFFSDNMLRSMRYRDFVIEMIKLILLQCRRI